MSIVSKLRQVLEGKRKVVESVNTKAGSTLPDTCKWDTLSETIDNISTGIETDDATATASDILKDKVAYGKEGRLVGAIETYDGASDVGSSGNEQEDALVSRTLTSYSNSRITEIGDYVFKNCNLLESVDLPNVTKVGEYAFHTITSSDSPLKQINIPKLETIGKHAFYYLTGVESVDFPLCKSIDEQAFSYSSIKSIDFPLCESLGKNAFQGANLLKTVKLPLVKKLLNGTFWNCYKLTTLYLASVEEIREMVFYNVGNINDIYLGYEGLVSLTNVNSFTGVTAGCKIHVKSAYADQYATATNWSSLIANGTIVIVGDYSD